MHFWIILPTKLLPVSLFVSFIKLLASFDWAAFGTSILFNWPVTAVVRKNSGIMNVMIRSRLKGQISPFIVFTIASWPIASLNIIFPS